MLCAPVFVFKSGSSALSGRPRCGLSIWVSLLSISNTLFWVYVNLFHEKTDKTRKYVIFVWYENGRRRLLSAQSINTESASTQSLCFAGTFSWNRRTLVSGKAGCAHAYKLRLTLALVDSSSDSGSGNGKPRNPFWNRKGGVCFWVPYVVHGFGFSCDVSVVVPRQLTSKTWFLSGCSKTSSSVRPYIKWPPLLNSHKIWYWGINSSIV